MAAELLKAELSLIADEKLRAFAASCLDLAPEYFWWAPASMSGRHHPEFARSEQGLVRHTRAAAQVFLDLAKAYPAADRDACIAALLLHDTLKYGTSSLVPLKTLPEHPLLPEQYYVGLKNTISPELWEAVFSRVRAHMGRWGPVMPATPDEWLVHLADYIASRRWALGLAETLEAV